MYYCHRIGAILLLTFLIPSLAWAQVGGGGGFGGGGGGGAGGGFGGGFGGGAGGGAGGANQNNAAGIKIDAEGVVALTVAVDGSGLLDKKRREALAKKHLSADLNQRTPQRFVSLVQLERELNELLRNEQPIPEELFYLAGLQRIEQIFVFPEEQDLVIAGPAEGFIPDVSGRMVGVETGRPVLRLDDLCVALRTVPRTKQLGCSIDPVPQRLAELQQFIKQGVPASVEEVEARFNQMDDILGLQVVRIDGVPEDSHFATMVVEADYRMKRIAMGLETPAIKGLKSHLQMLGGGGNAMQRWWFIPDYDTISRSDDGLAFEFSGQRAQLVAEDEVADAQGHRSSAPTTRKTTHAFARQFTEKFGQLANKSPAFAELQNLIDWSVLAALLQQERIPERIGWKRELLLDETRLPHPRFEIPRKTPSQVNYKRVGNQVIGLVGGGVTVNPQRIAAQTSPPSAKSAALLASQRIEAAQRITTTTASTTASTAASTAASTPVAHRWWWDSPQQAAAVTKTAVTKTAVTKGGRKSP